MPMIPINDFHEEKVSTSQNGDDEAYDSYEQLLVILPNVKLTMAGITKAGIDSGSEHTHVRKIPTPSANAAAALRAREYIALHNRQTAREQRLRRQFALREQNQNRTVSFSDSSNVTATAATSADRFLRTISTATARSDASTDIESETTKRSLISQCWRECWFLLTDIARDSEAEELENWPKRHPPPTLEHLACTTTFTVQEIKTMYRGFKQECPSGVVDEQTFMRIFQSFFPYGEAGSYAHYVFRLIDRNSCTGIISFEQFLRGLERMSRGTIESRLEWVFDLYDIEQRGYLTRYDVWRITHAVYDLVGRPARSPGGVGSTSMTTSSLLPHLARKSSASVHMIDDVLRKRSSLAYGHSISGVASGADRGVGSSSSEEHVDRVFDKLDLNRDGLVTKQEFLGACLRDEVLCASIAVLNTFI